MTMSRLALLLQCQSVLLFNDRHQFHIRGHTAQASGRIMYTQEQRSIAKVVLERR